jgi:hypothetical protein
MREDVLPIQFVELTPRVHYIKRRTQNEYSASCPECGGVPHQDGSFPDRFRLWVVSKHGVPLGWCRHCGYVWTPARECKPSREEIDAWRKEQEEFHKREMEKHARALELLQNERLWEKFYQNKCNLSEQVFKSWGISESWVDYLQLGLNPEYYVSSEAGAYYSPAATIPVWYVGGIVQNIKMRVLNPRSDNDRYRNHYKTGEQYLFVPMHDIPLNGAGILVEGEKKAIVLEQNLDDINTRVIGLQSKKPDPRLFENLLDLDPVYVWLDPDAFHKTDKSDESAVEYVTRLVGKERVRIVQSPVKVDDGINMYELDPRKYLKNARKA